MFCFELIQQCGMFCFELIQQCGMFWFELIQTQINVREYKGQSKKDNPEKLAT
jgi:hypothetical protein